MTCFNGMHGFGVWLPVVECSGDANGTGGWVSEFKADWFQLAIGLPAGVVFHFVFHKAWSIEPG
jgi:hypothetical protein